MQKAYLQTLTELAEGDRNVLSLIGDSGTGYDELFRRDFPGQFFDFGIAEEHMVAAAAGLASRGKIPFVYTAGAFLAYRAFEFIRDDLCFQRQNVKVAGMGSGLAWSTLGPTHHTTEDLSVLRALPELTIFSPASPLEVRRVVQAAYGIEGPVYLRLGMGGEPELYPEGTGFEVGKALELRSGDDLAIFSTGSVTGEVLGAARMLEGAGIGARVVNVHTIKPFDGESVLRAAEETGMIFSVEEHSTAGGLGGLMGETLSDAGAGVPLKRIGIPGVFARGYGTLQEVRRANGLDSESLFRRILTAYRNL